MSWFRCVDTSGGGGVEVENIVNYMTLKEFTQEYPVPGTPMSIDGYTYDIETTSTGGSSASVQITEYLNGVMTQQKDYSYGESKVDIFNDIRIDYGNLNYQNWTIIVKLGHAVTIDGIEYTTENSLRDVEAIHWGYSSEIEYTGCVGKTQQLAPFNPDPNTLYNLLDDATKKFVIATYLGSNRITSNPDIDDYEVWFENFYPLVMNEKYNTGIILGGDNENRDWQIEFNIKRSPDDGECSLITVYNENREVYTQNNNLVFYNYLFNNGYGSTTIVSDYGDKDIIIKKENGLLTVSVEGTVVYSIDDYVMPTKALCLFRYYTDSYAWPGIINYFGFKWLS